MKRTEFYPLDSLLDQFEGQWNVGQRPSIEQVLAANNTIDSSILLQELMLIEIERRRQLGESIEEREYRERFAGADEIVARVFELIDAPNDTAGAPCGAHQGPQSTRHPLAFPGATVGPYELIEPLGKGAFGEVWLGKRDGALATTQVAIKIPWVSETTGRILREEAKSWVRASGHPNVVPIIEADVYGKVVAIVSEYVDGGTLEFMIQDSGTLAPPIAVETAIGVLAGLEFLHARTIVHRDLKPANILLQSGIPRLTDFGLARQGDDSNSIAGTPAYMAPEAFDGICSVQTDLWSAAVVLFEMLAGHVPFQADSLAPMIELARVGPLELPSHIPGCLQDVLIRGLSKDPADRYRSAADMRAALSDCRRQLARQGRTTNEGAPHHLTIAVTGSMDANPEKVRQRLSLLLAPYQTRLTTWYTGSNGVVDEQAAAMLADANQQVLLVGYTEDDMSHQSVKLIETHDLPFVDALSEDVPPEPNAPSRRDIFFATKSDLVILVWDGVSQGTLQLQQWLQQHHRDHLMIYV